MSNSNAKKTGSYVHFITVTGILSAAAFVLQLIEFPVPMFMPTFIKLDFSDLPALLGAFSAGPLSGVLIELIKNLLHVTVSGSFGVGELSNFILGAIFTGIAGLMYKRKKSKMNALIASITGAIVMGLISFPSNLFVVYPVYYNFMPKDVIVAAYQAILPSVDSIEKCLLLFNVPFTIIKGFLNVILCFLIYKPLSPILKGRH
ncbi:MAG: ECF transporter S component [Lachnospiraceae bacterium]|nr:ECF transporter S component [Lachnospiraceae bacterium]